MWKRKSLKILNQEQGLYLLLLYSVHFVHPESYSKVAFSSKGIGPLRLELNFSDSKLASVANKSVVVCTPSKSPTSLMVSLISAAVVEMVGPKLLFGSIGRALTITLRKSSESCSSLFLSFRCACWAIFSLLLVSSFST